MVDKIVLLKLQEYMIKNRTLSFIIKKSALFVFLRNGMCIQKKNHSNNTLYPCGHHARPPADKRFNTSGVVRGCTSENKKPFSYGWRVYVIFSGGDFPFQTFFKGIHLLRRNTFAAIALFARVICTTAADHHSNLTTAQRSSWWNRNRWKPKSEQWTK